MDTLTMAGICTAITKSKELEIIDAGKWHHASHAHALRVWLQSPARVRLRLRPPKAARIARALDHEVAAVCAALDATLAYELTNLHTAIAARVSERVAEHMLKRAGEIKNELTKREE